MTGMMQATVVILQSGTTSPTFQQSYYQITITKKARPLDQYDEKNSKNGLAIFRMVAIKMICELVTRMTYWSPRDIENPRALPNAPRHSLLTSSPTQTVAKNTKIKFSILIKVALVICGLFICNFMYMQLRNGFFLGRGK